MADMADCELNKTVCLVQAAQEGDNQALEDLFARYLPRVRRIVALRMGRHLHAFAEVEDIVQQALLKAFTRLKTFEHRSEGSFRYWLARLVQDEIVACARRGGAKKRGGGRVRRFRDYPSQALSESFFPAQGPSPSSVVHAREREQQIEAALLSMPQHHREVIILRQFCGLSYKEIVEAMGFRQEESARKAWYRALQKLKKALNV